jgi:hypothetical protein
MPVGLKYPVKVSLDRLFLDPNNPRLANEHRPGYGNPGTFFEDGVQAELEQQIRKKYRVGALINSILGMGWTPVDAILVWEPPPTPGRYLVVEGNTRTVALRTIRRNYERERARLARARDHRSLDPGRALDQEAVVARYDRVIAATDELEVHPLAARDAGELGELLPRLLGVRHISHAQQWKPYATNLYIYSLYLDNFHAACGDVPLRLDDGILEQVAGLISISLWKARRSIQTAVAFSHFRDSFEGRLPEGDGFADQDQGYFQRLLEPGYARQRFGLREEDLWLRPEMEEVLFRWAFAKPRSGAYGSDNRNVLRSGDDISLWTRMARYDDQHKTSFAQQLDPERPEEARPMAELELDYLAHRNQQSPLEAIQGLLGTLKRVEVETLRAHRSQMRPAIEELLRLGHDFQAILNAID